MKTLIKVTQKMRKSIGALLLLLFVLTPLLSNSQVNRLSKEERDSLRAIPYPHTLPIFGQRVRNKGIDLPLPLGFMVTYIHQRTEVNLEDPRIALGGSDFVSIDFVDFEPVENYTNVVNFRADAWVFPFLNLYGIYAHSKSDSFVRITFPIELDIHRTPTANTYGFGSVLAYGMEDYFAAFNLNYSWSHTSALDRPVQGRVMSLRLGRSFELGRKNQSINASIGFQNQKITRDSSGELTVDEIFGLLDQDNLNDLKDQIADTAQNWYDDLSLPQKVVVDQLVDLLQDYLDGKDVGQTPLRYNFDKVPVGEWSVQLGVQYNHNKHWWFRLEAGIGRGREQIMTSVNYRFGL
ncbi:hypothetical protein ML462_01095 [Gramella lutea]|uniref:Uncharacterized protein n=1 Tax=Christiangramia lutea TaxID=1607951 RepID=A0A9X2A801_9FLAO|nr:hypothetical protein [Christiangramia lutea]MCH4821755.1 hypothetical protein [Christiangramia lutea]